jgi:hypothetical protein
LRNDEHLSERHLKAAGTTIDKAKFSEPKQVKRSRKSAQEMNAPSFEVTDIVRAADRSFIEKNRSRLTWQHLRVLRLSSAAIRPCSAT